MSLIADLIDSARGARAETDPPLPFTATSGSIMSGLFGNKADPTERQLDLTTTESTLLSILDLISGDVGSVAWDLYRGNRTADMCPPDGAKPLTENQHLAVKLWNQPNDFMTGDHLRTVVSWHYDAVGEGWVVADLGPGGVPRSFWPVRPDRMAPKTSADKYLTGYVYTGPGGERVPLELNEVLRITRPHPLDPHRGLGPVPALMLPLTTSLTSQQWINAFYRNDATPGGILQLNQDAVMADDDYDTIRKRWNEQHKGVNRAHRVGILEIGEFKPTVVDLRKLQATEMRNLTRDQVLEAYRIHKHMMGISDDVNRANAAAADDTYAKRTLKPRVSKWYGFANGPYLRCFGATGRGVVWCPENVVPEDEEAENLERTSKAAAAKSWRDAGFDPASIAEMMGVPLLPSNDVTSDGLATMAQKYYLAAGIILSPIEIRQMLKSAGYPIVPENWPPKEIGV